MQRRGGAANFSCAFALNCGARGTEAVARQKKTTATALHRGGKVKFFLVFV